MTNQFDPASFLDQFSLGFCYLDQDVLRYNERIKDWYLLNGWTIDTLAGHIRRRLASEDMLYALDGYTWKGIIPEGADIPVWIVFPRESKPFDVPEEYENLYAELKSVFDASYDEIFVTDGKGYTVRVNSACERNYGLAAEDIIGRHVNDLVAAGIFSRSATLDVIEKRKRINLIQETQNGRKLLVTATPVFAADGELIRVVSNSRDITELLHLREQLDQLQERVESYEEALQNQEAFAGLTLTVRSPAMLKILAKVEKVARVDSTILLLGESGVGKTHLVRYLHNLSARRHEPLLSINCSALPESLIESELFGYEAGAFSGALQKGKKGLFEAANGGTLFLDEIGELPLTVQAKLLTALQERKFFRVGGTTPVHVDVRIIAATNQDLKQKVEAKTFRSDLYYRLNVIPITVPPLRERREDIIPLALSFLDEFKEQYGISKRLTHTGAEELRRTAWPGNIRELRNFLERLIVTVDEDELTAAHIAGALADERNEEPLAPVVATLPLKDQLEWYEGQIVRRAYETCRSTYEIAELLGISQSSAVRKVNKYVKEL